MFKSKRWIKRGAGGVALGLLAGCGGSLEPQADVEAAGGDSNGGSAGAEAPDSPSSPDSPGSPPEMTLEGCGDLPTFAAQPVPVGPDAWTLSGVAGDSGTAEGTCGGAGRETVLEFVAPAAGYWTFGFDTDRTAFAGVIHLRTICEDPGTELACSIDRTRGWQLGLAAAELAAGQRVFLFVDTGMGRGGEYTLGVFRADAPIAPTLTDAQAFSFPEGRTTLRVTGTDPNGDVKWLRYMLLDAAGGPIDPRGFGETTYEVESARPTVGLGAPVGVLTDLPGGVASVRVELVDATGAASAPLEVPVQARPGAALGAPCDTDGVQRRCAADLVCLGDDRGAGCVAPTPPRVVSANAYRRHDGLLAFALSGADQTRDAAQFLAALLPEDDDTPLVLDIDGNIEGEIFTQPFGGVAEFDAEGYLVVDFGASDLSEFPSATRARVTLVDDQGLRSEPVIVPIAPTPLARAGAGCDPWLLTDQCEASTFCLGLYGGSEGRCADVIPPVLDEVSVSGGRGGLLRVTAKGHRTEYDPLAIDVSLLTENSDEGISLPDYHDLYFFPTVDAETGDFTLDTALVAGPSWDPLPIREGDFAGLTRLKFVARDAEGLLSEPVIVPLPIAP